MTFVGWLMTNVKHLLTKRILYSVHYIVVNNIVFAYFVQSNVNLPTSNETSPFTIHHEHILIPLTHSAQGFIMEFGAKMAYAKQESLFWDMALPWVFENLRCMWNVKRFAWTFCVMTILPILEYFWIRNKNVFVLFETVLISIHWNSKNSNILWHK